MTSVKQAIVNEQTTVVREGTYNEEAGQVDVHPGEGVDHRGASQLKVAKDGRCVSRG